jgi:hypothetical protein
MTDSLLDPNKQEPQIDPSKNYLEELVGEGKKYKDQIELAKAAVYKDLHIQQIETENAELREEFSKLRKEHNSSASLAERIDQLIQLQQQKASSDNNNTVKAEDKQGIDPAQFDSLLDAKLTAREADRRARDNMNAVKKGLEAQFGNGYPTVLKQTVENLGLTVEDADALARKSPAAFFKTLGLEPKAPEGFQAPPSSGRRTDSFAPTSGPKRTNSYYEKMRKENPNLYFSKQMSLQRERDYRELGPAFEDGNFNNPEMLNLIPQ